MIVVNTETIPGMVIKQMKGIVQGNTIRAKHVGRDIAASLKNIIGGELKGYTELLTESRRQAVERMIAQAEQLQANAIVNVRFSTSAITQGAAELYVYGTAMVVEPEAGADVEAEAGVTVKAEAAEGAEAKDQANDQVKAGDGDAV